MNNKHQSKGWMFQIFDPIDDSYINMHKKYMIYIICLLTKNSKIEIVKGYISFEYEMSYYDVKALFPDNHIVHIESILTSHNIAKNYYKNKDNFKNVIKGPCELSDEDDNNK